MNQAVSPSVKTEVVSNQPKDIVDFTHVEAQVLYTIYSVFPLSPMPATVTIRPTAVSIVHDLFGLSRNVKTISISDIFTVEVESGLFFATIKFQQKQAHLEEIDVEYVWKEDAYKLRRIVQGLMIVEAKDLEINAMKPTELVDYLEEIGGTKS